MAERIACEAHRLRGYRRGDTGDVQDDDAEPEARAAWRSPRELTSRSTQWTFTSC
jgi:hypothetical protein